MRLISPTRRTARLLAVSVVAASLALTACGAGSRTGNETATKVACNFTNPPAATAVNVLAYNSSAIDPFTNTMVSSCTKDNVTVKHDPIDFGGQVQKTTATLSSDAGSYDILETYSVVISDLGSRDKLMPLDDLFAKHKDEYKLDDIDKTMRETMSYDGKLYGIPMQAQAHVLAYRKDLFDKNGIAPPTTFEEMKAASKKLQEAEGMKYPLALTWLATGDVGTSCRNALISLGKTFVDEKTKKPNFNTPEAAAKAFEQMIALKPYMDPQVTTFDQPKVQQQLFNGTAAMGIMYSGRMVDLTQQKTPSSPRVRLRPAAVGGQGGQHLRHTVGGRLVAALQHQARQGPALRDGRLVGRRGSVQGQRARRLSGPQGRGPERLAVRRGGRGRRSAKGPSKEFQPWRPGRSTTAIRAVIADVHGRQDLRGGRHRSSCRPRRRRSSRLDYPQDRARIRRPGRHPRRSRPTGPAPPHSTRGIQEDTTVLGPGRTECDRHVRVHAGPALPDDPVELAEGRLRRARHLGRR